MLLSDVYVGLGQQAFEELVRGISIGKLKTYQLYDGLKARAHLVKLNSETLRKSTARSWSRLGQGDEELAKDLAQAVLVSHLDLIVAVLDFVGIPNENGFFAKDIDPQSYLSEGWEQRVLDRFRGTYPESLLLFYINHLAWELLKAAAPFRPQAEAQPTSAATIPAGAPR
jgi:hypothetical protein